MAHSGSRRTLGCAPRTKALLLAGAAVVAVYFVVGGSAPAAATAAVAAVVADEPFSSVAVDLDPSGRETALEASAKANPALQLSSEYPLYEAVVTAGTTKDQVEVSASSVRSEVPPTPKEEAALHENDDAILEDAEAFRAAPLITSPGESASIKYRMIVLQHERYYKTHPSRLYVPRLRKDARLSIKEFAERFIKQSQPVIVPFEAMRHLGFKMRSFTLDELLEKYPNYKRTFTYKYGSPGPGEMDLGPAVWALKQGDSLRKTVSGRNFPRNTKVSLEKLSKLGVQTPPYVLPGTPMLAPSLWFATVTSSTKLHSDCCDNYAMMISGTKRWTVSPPHEARQLHPACYGGLCWVKSLEHNDEHATTPKQMELRDRVQSVTFDLRPDEMLYLPCGWFHHVENLGPTIMINHWTRGGAGFLRFLDGTAYKSLSEEEKELHAEEARRD